MTFGNPIPDPQVKPGQGMALRIVSQQPIRAKISAPTFAWDMRGNRGNILQQSKSSTSNTKCYRCIRADGDLLFQHLMPWLHARGVGF
jgi:hypothetical protein